MTRTNRERITFFFSTGSDGVVGYHARLTRARSRVRSSVRAFLTSILGRVVKALDLSPSGLSPRGFEPRRMQFVFRKKATGRT